MTPREQAMDRLIVDLCLGGANTLAQPRNTAARDQLRRAVHRASAWRKAQAAASRADALTPRDPRPEPPPSDHDDALPAPELGSRVYRSPYRED